MSGGPAPFGMRWNDGELVPDLAETTVVRELVEAYVASGGRVKATVATLNENGHTTRRGARWSDTAVSRILRNRSLAKLIPKELWRRCAPLLSERDGGDGQPRRRSAHPLGGLVHCRCGGRMYARGNGNGCKYVCRGCRRKILEDTLESLFQASLASIELGAAELVAALADNPRAAEITRQLGAGNVKVHEIWPDLNRSRRCQLVDLLVNRIVVGRDEVSVVFAESGGNDGKSAPSQNETLPSSHSSVSETNEATKQEGSSGILEPKAYRIQHVAELLNLPKSTVYDLVRTGVLTSIRTGRNGGVVLVPAEAVAGFLEKKKRRR